MNLEIPADRYVLAVSGGVDSVVMLDLLTKVDGLDLIVAHFDHGIRDDSRDDEKLVSDLAKKYGLKFESKREELGKNASEELARDRRYAFLRSVMQKYQAKLVTAHHSDDVIESILINLSRGTGWRGLAVLDSDVLRPMTKFRKSEILEYAKENKLPWHEDSTNASDAYLRNQFRRKLDNFDADKKLQLLALWSQQKYLKKLINDEIDRLIDDKNEQSRYFFANTEPDVAIECLRFLTKTLLTRPQLERLLIAIKTIPSGKKFMAGCGIEISFTTRFFTIKLIK